MFRRYEKVSRMDASECDGLLHGTVFVFEKVDGSNASIWKDEKGNICTGSRNHQLSCGGEVFNEFRGFPKYVLHHEGIKNFLEKYPHLRLYGEWLVKHTINYNVSDYNKFYLFDVYDDKEERYLTYAEYDELIKDFPGAEDIIVLRPIAIYNNPSLDAVKELVGKTNFDIEAGEGVVLKNYDFVNRFGRTPWGKIVRDDFKEMNRILFNSVGKGDLEAKIIAQFVNEARVRKVTNKIAIAIQQEPSVRETARVLNTVYHDLIEEEMWEILKRYKNPTIDFKRLNSICNDVARNLYFNILAERSS